MIDVSRHFIPLDILKRNIDGMEAVKMNVFHWHLSENQGFRVESKKFPKLHEMGSDGLYYTQDEIRDLIAYARERGIRVVPEFDMPGHSTAWFVGYPELASGPGPYDIERKWGVFDPAMDPTNEKLYKFLDELIGEMAKLFPGPLFSHRRRRSERQAVGRESEDSGVQEVPQPEKQRGAASVLQPARAEAGDETRQSGRRVGRSLYPRRAEGHRDSVLARRKLRWRKLLRRDITEFFPTDTTSILAGRPRGTMRSIRWAARRRI